MVNIVIKWDQMGEHCWPDAPDDYSTLRSLHGHIFHFELYIPVTASRQIEFLDARQQIVKRLGEYMNWRDASCEMIATQIRDMIKNYWGVLPSRVVVMEDQFVGAEWIKEIKNEACSNKSYKNVT